MEHHKGVMEKSGGESSGRLPDHQTGPGPSSLRCLGSLETYTAEEGCIQQDWKGTQQG